MLPPARPSVPDADAGRAAARTLGPAPARILCEGAVKKRGERRPRGRRCPVRRALCRLTKSSHLPSRTAFSQQPLPPVDARLERFDLFPSAYVAPRHVDVWLPAAYEEAPHRAFPVLYVHDGQNLFDPALSFSGVAWEVDRTVEHLVRDGAVEPCIVVGIWNTPQRIPEYMPQKPMERLDSDKLMDRFVQTYGGPPSSDAYLRFMVEELKPFVDRLYRTRTGPEDTTVMGSSMGGLVSLYAWCEYPDVFGGAGCLSTSWTVGGRAMLPYLRDAVPDPADHRVYFDFGVEAHIATYETYQRRVDQILRQTGYVRDHNWMTERFPGAEHSEQAWRDRLDVPLHFLLPPPSMAYGRPTRLCA